MMIEKIQWRSMNVSAQPISINEHQHDAYDDEKRLDIIDLSGLSLDTISLPAIHLAAICKLDLSNNNLLKIPETIIARLVNVVALDVHSNQLTTLPDSIGCLSKLKLLNVSSNLLHSLPQTIKKCRMLEELSANFNKLSALPETIGFELLNLKKLSVNSNRIMFLPYSTPHLTALRLLDVRLNCLRLLPEDLEGMVNLEVLNVSQNFHYLSKLPDSVGLLVSLVELDVSYNNITTLPSSIGSLKRLRKLDVEANPLVSPPMHITEMGLHTLKIYLTGAQLHINSPTQKKTWFGQLKKHKTRNTTNDAAAAAAAASTGRYKAMLSPHRLFS